MPKKTANTRSSVQQRRKPKAQKSFELVRPVSAEDEIENNDDNADEPTSVGVATSTVSAPSQKRVKTTTPSIRSEKAAATLPESEKSTAQKTEKTPVLNTVEDEEPAEAVEETVPVPAPKSSASARLAARRQAAQKAQRSVSLISAENYTYVRKDLVIIAILAIIMFTAIIILHFVPAIGG
jgi:hypothetical protein